MQGVRRLLGGSWVVISRVLSPLIWVISIVTLLITLHLQVVFIQPGPRGSGLRLYL